MAGGAPDDYGSPVFAAWRAAAQPAWQGYVEHEFVRRLGDGSLEQRAFMHYLAQDYVFLRHYARAWSMVAVKADAVAAMRVAAATAHALLAEEIRLHVATCAAQGMAESELENTPCLLYTSDAADE